MSSGINGNMQVKVQHLQQQVTVNTAAEKKSSDSVADFGNQHKQTTDDVTLSKTQVTTATTTENNAKSTLSSLTSELTGLTKDVSDLSEQIKTAKGKGEDVSDLTSKLEAKNKELEAKKAEVETAKKDVETKKSEKQAAEIALQKAEAKQIEVVKQLSQAQATNKTDKTTLDASVKELDAAKTEAADAEKAAKEQEENEQLKQMCNGNEELAKKLQGSYDPKAGESLAQTAHELHQNGTFNNYCALGVRQSLEAEGILEENEIRGHASDLIEKYGASGKFDVIQISPEETKDLPEGTILAVKKEEGSTDGSIGQYGHIAIIGYKRDENGEVIKDKDGNPVREEISDHVGGMRDRTGKECYVIIPKNGEPIGTPKDSTGTGHYIGDGSKSAIEDSNLDSSTKSILLGKIAGHQELTEEDEEMMKKANISIDTSISSSTPTGTGTGRYMDSRLKAGIERSNLDDATKARLLAMPEDSELSDQDAKLLSGTNLSGVGVGTRTVKAFGEFDISGEQARRNGITTAKTTAQRQALQEGFSQTTMNNIESNYITEEHAEYLKNNVSSLEKGNPEVVMDNIPEVLYKSRILGDNNGYTAADVSDLRGLDAGHARKNSSVMDGRDNIITIDELKSSKLTSNTITPEVRVALIQFLEDNDRSQIDINKLRQLVIDAYEAGDGRHVNFMDCLL